MPVFDFNNTSEQTEMVQSVFMLSFASIVSIGAGAFQGCTGMKTLKIGAKVTTISAKAEDFLQRRKSSNRKQV